jgi:hypothetical protein
MYVPPYQALPWFLTLFLSRIEHTKRLELHRKFHSRDSEGGNRGCQGRNSESSCMTSSEHGEENEMKKKRFCKGKLLKETRYLLIHTNTCMHIHVNLQTCTHTPTQNRILIARIKWFCFHPIAKEGNNCSLLNTFSLFLFLLPWIYLLALI